MFQAFVVSPHEELREAYTRICIPLSKPVTPRGLYLCRSWSAVTYVDVDERTRIWHVSNPNLNALSATHFMSPSLRLGQATFACSQTRTHMIERMSFEFDFRNLDKFVPDGFASESVSHIVPKTTMFEKSWIHDAMY